MTVQKLPTNCPSCTNPLQVTNLNCSKCDTKIEGNYVLPAILKLSKEEQHLMLSFLKRNGKLQELSGIYGLSYPSIRKRLDALIAKVKLLKL